MIDIRPVITGRVSPGRSDIIGIGIAKDFDQTVVEIGLALDNGLLKLGDLVRLAAEQLTGVVGMIEDRDRVVHGSDRSLINLFEVGLARADGRWIDVERHNVLGQPERVQPAIRHVEL